MTKEQFKGLPLDPESAMMNIDALVNASLFFYLIDDQVPLAIDILTVASDYIATIRKEREKFIQGGG